MFFNIIVYEQLERFDEEEDSFFVREECCGFQFKASMALTKVFIPSWSVSRSPSKLSIMNFTLGRMDGLSSGFRESLKRSLNVQWP